MKKGRKRINRDMPEESTSGKRSEQRASFSPQETAVHSLCLEGLRETAVHSLCLEGLWGDCCPQPVP